MFGVRRPRRDPSPARGPGHRPSRPVGAQRAPGVLIGVVLVFAVLRLPASVPAPHGFAAVPSVAAASVTTERLPDVDAVVWAEPRGAGEVLWVALEPDWQPVRVAEAPAVWGVVSPDGRQIIAQLCTPEADDLLWCEHRIGPLGGPIQTVGTVSVDRLAGPRHDVSMWADGGSTSIIAGFSPDSAWAWWVAAAAEGIPMVVLAKAAQPETPIAATAYSDLRWMIAGHVLFSGDSTRVYVHRYLDGNLDGETVVLSLDQPGAPARRLDDGAEPLSPDSHMEVVRHGEDELVLRSEGTVLAPRGGARLRQAAAIERGVVLVQERDGRLWVSLYDPTADRETVVFETKQTLLTWNIGGTVFKDQTTVSTLVAPDGHTFVILIDSADNPPEPTTASFYEPRFRREVRLYSAAGELLEDFGPGVYGCNQFAATYAPNGRHLLVTRPDGDSLVLNLDTGRRHRLPSGLLDPGMPPAIDLTATGEVWTVDWRPGPGRWGVWTEAAGFREVAPAGFMSLLPGGKYALIGESRGMAAIANADGSAVWPLSLNAAVGWAGNAWHPRRHAWGLDCGV